MSASSSESASPRSDACHVLCVAGADSLSAAAALGSPLLPQSGGEATLPSTPHVLDGQSACMHSAVVFACAFQGRRALSIHWQQAPLAVPLRAGAPPAVDAGGTPGEAGAPSSGSSETVAEKLEAQQAAAASAAARAAQAYDRRVQVRGVQSAGAGAIRTAGCTHVQACHVQ